MGTGQTAYSVKVRRRRRRRRYMYRSEKLLGEFYG
jgi:hypothetical protein